MPDETKYIGGPKSDETKAISSRNSTTHGLTARRWINDNEQELFDTTVKALMVDFDPETYIEKMLITKMAECSVRLLRIQNVESSMFDLANSEAEHPNEIVKSLNNGDISSKLVKAIRSAYLNKPLSNDKLITYKTSIINEISSHNIDDIRNWNYIDKHMPLTAIYIVNKSTEENKNLYTFIFEESDDSVDLNMKVFFVNADDLMDDETSEDLNFNKDVSELESDLLQKYLRKLIMDFDNDIKIQSIINNLEDRSKQVKNSAMPDTQKLGLIQRYRTADERLFSKSFRELIAIQDRRKNI
jgi:hypothetical protein